MIRPVGPEDTASLLALWLDSTIRAHPFIHADYWRESLPLVRDRYLPQAQSWLDERDGRPVGFISVLAGRFIGGLFVAPSHHRQGVGGALMTQAKGRYPLLSLEVYRLNKPACAFYYQQDFRQVASGFNGETGHMLLTLQWQRR